MTLAVEIEACTTVPMLTELPRTRMTRDIIRTGIVQSSKLLQCGAKGKAKSEEILVMEAEFAHETDH